MKSPFYWLDSRCPSDRDYEPGPDVPEPPADWTEADEQARRELLKRVRREKEPMRLPYAA